MGHGVLQAVLESLLLPPLGAPPARRSPLGTTLLPKTLVPHRRP